MDITDLDLVDDIHVVEDPVFEIARPETYTMEAHLQHRW